MGIRARSTTGLILTIMMCGIDAGRSPSLASDLDALMAAMARVREVRSSFRETRQIEGLAAPLTAEGTLAYSAPDHLEKHTTEPIQEQIVVDGEWLTYSKPAENVHYTMALENSRELRGLVEAVRATLAGDRVNLERYYTVTLAGPIESWQLALVPAGSRLQGILQSVTIFGQGADVHRIDTVEVNGDSSQMTIEPAAR